MTTVAIIKPRKRISAYLLRHHTITPLTTTMSGRRNWLTLRSVKN
jgi:hypothetical protein